MISLAPQSRTRLAQRIGGEASEHDRVRRTEASTGQHRDDRLGDHRHVDGDAVTRLDAELLDGIRGLGDLVLQLAVGDVAGVALGLADEVEGHPVAVALLDVPVDAVVRRVEASADEPLGEWSVAPVEDLVERLGPADPLSLLGPEGEPVVGSLVISVRLQVRVLGQVGRWIEVAVLVGQIADRVGAHGVSSSGLLCIVSQTSGWFIRAGREPSRACPVASPGRWSRPTSPNPRPSWRGRRARRSVPRSHDRSS